MAAIQTDTEGNPILSEERKRQVDDQMEGLFKEARAFARQTLLERWGLVRAIVHELFVKGQITGDRFKQLETEHSDPTRPSQRWVFSEELGHTVRAPYPPPRAANQFEVIGASCSGVFNQN
jgi:hypothetical protein